MGNNRTVSSDGILHEELGRKVTLRVERAPEGFQMRMKKCWATPSYHTLLQGLSYTLIDDCCPLDPSVFISRHTNHLEMSFILFTFTDGPNSHILLHCDIVLCAVDEICCKCKR